MYHKTKHNRFSKYFKILVALAVVTFGATLWILSSNLEYLSDVVAFELDSKEFTSPLKTIELINEFDREISIHYDDGEMGLYLSNLKSNEKIMISAAIGQGLYATELDNWERIDFVAIRQDVKRYVFSPHVKNNNENVFYRQLSIEKRTRPHPSVVKLHSGSAALATRFKSFSSRNVELYFEDRKGGLLQGHLHMGQETTTNSYPGHEFFVTEVGHRDREIIRFHIIPTQVVYYILDPEFPATPALMQEYDKEVEFMQQYYNRTGIQWRHYFGSHGPRPLPVLYMWPAQQIGDVHRVYSTQGYWNCAGSKASCQSSAPVKLELEVVSLKPRVFIIENFLNDFEATEIIRLAQPKLHHSSVGDVAAGAFESDTRTSQNSWLSRETSIIIDSLYMRAADMLQIDEKLLHRNKNVEDIQVVHYVNGQHYDAHHDWGVSGHPESRYLTLLLYLTDMVNPDAGGETSFPKGLDGRGFKVSPKKTTAVLFYNLLEDGNGDDLSLHAALPVREGEKWLANFWVWDPRIH